MASVDFASYTYFPALQCSFPEHHGYRQLCDEDKNNLLPIFELGQCSYDDGDFAAAIKQITATASTRPFILDLCKDPCPPPFVSLKKSYTASEQAKFEEQKSKQKSYNAALSQLLNPADGFKVWRALVATFPNCIPVLQFSDAASQSKNILRQGSMLARRGSLAIRINADTDPAIHSTIGSLVATLDTASSLLIIVDCGQGRVRIAERAEFARKTIATIVSEVDVPQRPDIRAVCVSSSFPNANNDRLKEYPNLDSELFEQALEAFPFMFGDYAANYRRRNQSTFMPADWRATVTSPSRGGWLIYRDPNAKDQEGWKTGSKLIQEHEEYLSLDAWGAVVIAKAANGTSNDNKSNRFWHAAKVNLHLHNQVNLSNSSDGDDIFG